MSIIPQLKIHKVAEDFPELKIVKDLWIKVCSENQA